MATKKGLDQHDVDILRRLAERKATIALDPVNLARRKQWLDHDAGEIRTKPMVLAEAGGVMNEVIPESILQCRDPGARGMEMGLRAEIYQFEEFIFPYQLRVAEKFGMCYYGCCESVHTRWHVLKKLPNLERVSVSPWCDEEFMARELGTRYVYSRKPNPTQVSTSVFDEAAIRADLRKTLTVAKGCRVEFAMKDVHTLANEPKRLPRWVQLARETIDEVWK